ncbi:S41 family peptidase [Chitinophaga nivalis]|uniref:S41 family peptidase n=1 Tax=Chitinophaga nivalis TaxID=2991709 RepID=A0ABT3IMT0_9BACT|nr:S41 family peptidase [Chitinophaga nivalis]MCW3465024.1 S41 family peptidase [Chitinophaga nivalis]MCW3485284.1 S41 family peptidase [Chitinophaga nivalis]
MKISYLFALLLLLCTASSHAQNNCNCAQAVEKLIAKIETEYPGFKEKTTDTLLYNHFKAGIIEKSWRTDDAHCLALLKEYTQFFKDRHIFFLDQTTPQPQDKKAGKATVTISAAAFHKKISTTKDPLEGIWKSDNYKIGILKTDKTTYTGFILETNSQYWQPNDVKFVLHGTDRVDYYLQDRSMFKDTFTLYSPAILYFRLLKSAFIKQPLLPADTLKIQAQLNEIEGFYVKQLTPATTLLRLKSFDYPFVDRIEALIKANRALIENSQNLIIDIRQNGGGTDLAYKPILPYILTNPTLHTGATFLVTQTLLDGLEKYKKGLPRDEKHQAEIAGVDHQLNAFTGNIGKYINPDEGESPVSKIAPALKSPQQIVILTDRKVASSAENFLLVAKQSKKVKVFGTPTSGVLDYGSARVFDMGCANYPFVMPTYRSLRLPAYPIDNIGIQPDVYLDNYITDWMQYAINYLEDKQ